MNNRRALKLQGQNNVAQINTQAIVKPAKQQMFLNRQHAM
jgi:hypothetical protein